MKHYDNLGTRMKQYENCYRFYLTPNSCVIVRIDGRAFHTFTKGFARPYDKLFAQCMWETAYRLCQNVSGCKFGYTQSDEITLVLTDYESIKTEPWFGNNLQKIVSITASMATLFFNEEFRKAVGYEALTTFGANKETVHTKALTSRMAIFDARAFVVPREEIFNVLYWRQLDCVRNSIQLLGQANFSHKQLQGKNQNEIQEMLWQEKGINWAKEPEWFKNGVALYKVPVEVKHNDITIVREKWGYDLNTPMFTKDRNFVLKHI